MVLPVMGYRKAVVSMANIFKTIIKKIFTEAVVEGIKEVGRNSIMAVTPVISTALVQVQGGNSVNWKVVGIVAGATFGLAVLGGIDKWIHESKAKLLKNVNGIVPF